MSDQDILDSEIEIVNTQSGAWTHHRERMDGYGVKVALCAAGDLDEDGLEEIITGPGPDPRMRAVVKIFRRDGTLLKEIRAYPNGLGFGLEVSKGGMGE